MTRTDYRNSPALNFSLAKHLLRSPAHYQAALATPREETPDMRLGTLTHTAILEPQVSLNQTVAIKPEGMNFTTKEGKAWRDRMIPGKVIISESDWQAIHGMMQSVFAHKEAMMLLDGCRHRETPMFANLRGVDCKALLDAHGHSHGYLRDVIVDLKTTDDASPEAFARKVDSLDYDMQAAWYSMVLGAAENAEDDPLFYWIAVEKTPPFSVAVYEASDWLFIGQEKVFNALETYKRCKERDEWPQPYPHIQTLKRPAWSYRKEGQA